MNKQYTFIVNMNVHSKLYLQTFFFIYRQITSADSLLFLLPFLQCFRQLVKSQVEQKQFYTQIQKKKIKEIPVR